MELSRRAVGALTVSAVAGLAGCSGSGATTFEADAAATATGDTGYEREDERTPTITREFAGQEVKVTNVITEYQKTMRYLFTPTERVLNPLKRPKIRGKIAFISDPVWR